MVREAGTPVFHPSGSCCRLQSEVQRLQYLLEAKNLEVSQMQSAVVEYEQLTKELADVLLKYHRHCLTASRGKIPRFRARMERVNYFCEDSCIESTHLQHRARDARLNSPAVSCKMGPLSCTQPTSEKYKNAADTGSQPVALSKTCNRFRDSGWSIRWGQDSALDAVAQVDNDASVPEGRMDAGTHTNQREESADCGDCAPANEYSKQTAPTGSMSEQDKAKGILGCDRFRDDEDEVDDIVNGNNFLSTLSSLSMHDRNNTNHEYNKFSEDTREVFRFSGAANKLPLRKYELETGTSTPMGSTTTSVASKRPKPADSLGKQFSFHNYMEHLLRCPLYIDKRVLCTSGLADKYLGRENRLTEHNVSPFAIGFAGAASRYEGQKLIKPSSQTQELVGITAKDKYPPLGRYHSNKGETLQGVRPDPSRQTQGATVLTSQSTMVGGFVEELPRLKPIKTQVESYPPSGSPAFISPVSRDLHHQDGYQHRGDPYTDNFSSCGGPKGDPPLDCTTPLKQLPYDQEEIKETLTAKLDRFEKLIGAKFPSHSQKHATPCADGYGRMSQPYKAGPKFPRSDDKFAARGDGAKFGKQGQTSGKGYFQKEKEVKQVFTRVLSEKQQENSLMLANEKTPTGALRGLQHSYLNMPTMASTFSPADKENSPAVNRTRTWASKGTGEGGKSAYESMLTMIKDGAYQLRKVTPVTKRRGTRPRRAASKPYMGSTFRRYLHARRQAIGDSDVDSDV